MLIGQTFTDAQYGRCEVTNVTPLSIAFRDSEGRRHWRLKPEAKRWRVGASCVVTPDEVSPADTCIGVIVEMRGKRPWRLRLEEHPVYAGAVVEVGEVFKVKPLRVA